MTKDNNNTLPAGFSLEHVYNPRFHLLDLISTRRNPFSSARCIPRPPNSFFLMKNCLMLELRLLGHRLAMPDLCRKAKLVWKEIPQEVKDRYDNLAWQAQVWHQTVFPEYRFKPKKRTTFKPYVVPVQCNGNGSMSTFPATNVTFLDPSSPSLESSGSESSFPSPQPSKNDPFLIEPIVPIVPEGTGTKNYFFNEQQLLYCDELGYNNSYNNDDRIYYY